MDRKVIIGQSIILFLLILANFAAQVPYFYHLYYSPRHVFPDLQSSVLLGSVFALFLAASFLLLIRKSSTGYWLMILFLSTEFLFYLRGVVAAGLHGFGWFFQVYNPDLVLRIVYSIGYMNLFASGYFLIILLSKRRWFLAEYSGR